MNRIPIVRIICILNFITFVRTHLFYDRALNICSLIMATLYVVLDEYFKYFINLIRKKWWYDKKRSRKRISLLIWSPESNSQKIKYKKESKKNP